ncbi:unnamed protein product [Zymoseptoria tritici ST99CH_1A5]|uniref:Uncharacterized protein n=1 Tax=Zymoseptoria tritici ST99CH_1A5 TaxID=1276529 RepID=A0A1Y6M0C4_ZYMTR|nr:unnamed protein product [Zymoseptoria tritici ST99CH_1A5]
MAAVESLGVHTPTGLQYLVSEGILPPDPRPERYQWETFMVADGEEQTEEEILTTEHAVVWSQGSFVRNVFRFDVEGEIVTQAILTTFPSDRAGDGTNAEASPARALVVLLRTKAHIYFLQGSHHIVDLPFEVERAFQAPRGLLLQRKRTSPNSLPPSPQMPSVPPNSFFSSQARMRTSMSFLDSPTLQKSFAGSKRILSNPTSGDSKLEALFQTITAASGKRGDDDVTNLYSLSGPLSDLGVVTYSLQHQKPRMNGRSQNGNSVEFEGLDPAEKIIYVSPEDELSSTDKGKSGPLVLLVTLNTDIYTITIWHAWYVDEKSLQDLLKHRKEQEEVKARRRSSFLSAGVAATGTTTPAVRRRDGARESFAAGGLANLPLPGDTAVTQAGGVPRKPTEEEVMASQMDPDYVPALSQQPARENRRISSMNTDVRGSQMTVNASFGSTGGRRATSFGGPAERRSLSHRKSRGSTPGSTYSRSVAGDDDSIMDLDSTIEIDDEESADGILRHIRATFEASGADSVFGSTDDGFKRELIVRKIHSFPVGSLSASRGMAEVPVGMHKVVTLPEMQSNNGVSSTKINVYIHDRQSRGAQVLTLRVKQRPLWPETANPVNVAIPLLVSENGIANCDDILRLQDSNMRAVLLGSKGIQFSLDEQPLCSLPAPATYRVYNPLSLRSQSGQSDKEVGRNRLLAPPAAPLYLQHEGTHGAYDEVSQDGVHHRRRLSLRPSHQHIDDLLSVCEYVLPKQQARALRKTWCMAYAWLSSHQENLTATKCDAEFVAFVATLFNSIIGLLDSKARAALNIFKLSSAKATASSQSTLHLRRHQHEGELLGSTPWSWMSQQPQPRLRSPKSDEKRKDQLLIIAAALADELSAASEPKQSATVAAMSAVKLMLALHIFLEEQKLCTLSSIDESQLAAVVAQIGSWLSLEDWSYGHGTYYHLEGAGDERWAYLKSKAVYPPQLGFLDQPIGVFQWFEHALMHSSSETYPSLLAVAQIGSDPSLANIEESVSRSLTPRMAALSDMLAATNGLMTSPVQTVELLPANGITVEMLDTLPEAVAAPFKEAIARCEKQPPTTWSSDLLRLVNREDLIIGEMSDTPAHPRPQTIFSRVPRDMHSACLALDQSTQHPKTREAGRNAVSQLIFSEDRRLVEASSLMHFNSVQVAQCPKQPEWDEATHFEHQRRAMQYVTTRMIALPAGDGMIHFDSQTPLLTEKYHLPGFNSSCLMQPMGHHLTTDRSGLTEEKVNWAYFHAGVSSGLRISRNVRGIDTSWIAFNKPNELTNRHAGLLLALGLGGHLRNMAKWLAFKYLTPKHTMTSVGLLLGLSASYIGTMDGLITRMLSVHITKMLPPGAAELNVSPTTQTAGLMGIGLVYCNTQHRRISEIMLSEVENMEVEDPDSGPDQLRDESYRLAAGFALGLINLAKGDRLRGLHGLQMPERLLAVAIGPRPVSAVHVFDRATAGAVIAIALIYMKTNDQSIAQKVNIPDTEAQFDHVRPDILLLRSMATHLILWDSIEARGPSAESEGWIHDNLPTCYKKRAKQLVTEMTKSRTIDSAHIPLFNVFTGLAWALSLKYAGSGNTNARDEILSVYQFFFTLNRGADAFYFDGKLGRASLRRCMDVLALCAAVVMAGTGDLETFRYLRRMHGRTDAETPYGSHLAAHLAIGVLFLGGGTFTFGTSDLAIAALVCAFYPLFPTDVHDNRVHLQAFRHLWVLAAEARCIVVEDIESHRPIHMPITLTLLDGSTQSLRAPCLLPELSTIRTVHTDDNRYWRVTLDFAANPSHIAAFRASQRVYVRRCPAAEAHPTVFTATLAALNEAQNVLPKELFVWMEVFKLEALRGMERADVERVLPAAGGGVEGMDERGSVVDEALQLGRVARFGTAREGLWGLRVLFKWAERARERGDGRLKWIGEEVVEGLRGWIEGRSREGIVAITTGRAFEGGEALAFSGLLGDVLDYGHIPPDQKKLAEDEKDWFGMNESQS